MYLRILSPKAEVHTHFCQPSALSAQRKGGGISQKGGTWVHLFGSVPEARTAQSIGYIKQTGYSKTLHKIISS